MLTFTPLFTLSFAEHTGQVETTELESVPPAKVWSVESSTSILSKIRVAYLNSPSRSTWTHAYQYAFVFSTCRLCCCIHAPSKIHQHSPQAQAEEDTFADGNFQVASDRGHSKLGCELPRVCENISAQLPQVHARPSTCVSRHLCPSGETRQTRSSQFSRCPAAVFSLRMSSFDTL